MVMMGPAVVQGRLVGGSSSSSSSSRGSSSSSSLFWSSLSWSSLGRIIGGNDAPRDGFPFFACVNTTVVQALCHGGSDVVQQTILESTPSLAASEDGSSEYAQNDVACPPTTPQPTQQPTVPP
eukprot:CAMPEP_0116544136 /NCGR_PEP_ID=MMETSP0397-20121206/1947_1 /TAXON_ID=216820 /ORGANISM="Cyclophora tenuis, Strain ECT3854" /LENGTH=122 /DNA_ID=CAMNT_0004068309 /DNA_START=307 /DNA_END=672 /DNA_ORIENTATION=+